MGSCKLAAVVATLIAASGVAVGAATVTPSGEVGSLLAPLGDPAWADAPLPAQTLPATRFESIVVDGLPGWRLVVQGSYGNRVHEVRGEAATARRLSWRWGLPSSTPFRRFDHPGSPRSRWLTSTWSIRPLEVSEVL